MRQADARHFIRPVHVRQHRERNIRGEECVSIEEEADASHKHDEPLKRLSVDSSIYLLGANSPVGFMFEVADSRGLVQASYSAFAHDTLLSLGLGRSWKTVVSNRFTLEPSRLGRELDHQNHGGPRFEVRISQNSF